MPDLHSGRTWMIFWVIVVVVVTVQTVALTVLGLIATTGAISVMSIEAMYLAAGAGFQSTLSMRKADPEDPL